MKYKFKILGCTYCNTCIYECPKKSITMTKAGAKINQVLCSGCGTCYDNCAFEAIKKIKLKKGG